MMRFIFIHVLMLSVLLAGVEGAMDIALDGVPHDGELSHLEDFGHPLDAHEDGKPGGELDEKHCAHCCHGHSAGLATQFVPSLSPLWDSGRLGDCSSYILSFSQAPPTPPPNA